MGLKGESKLADQWEKDVCFVAQQPNKQIPIYVVERENRRGAIKFFHRNLLLPFMALLPTKPVVDSNVEQHLIVYHIPAFCINYTNMELGAVFSTGLKNFLQTEHKG